METLERFGEGEKCIFCKENVVDELLFGKIYKYEDVITHYFCMVRNYINKHTCKIECELWFLDSFPSLGVVQIR